MKARIDRLKVVISMTQLSGKSRDSVETKRLNDRDAAAAAVGNNSERE